MIMSQEIFNIISDMTDSLSPSQLRRLEDVLVWRLSEEEKRKIEHSNEEYLKMFLASKKLEGCSPKTISCYERIISNMFSTLDMPMIKITTDAIRKYMSNYQEQKKCQNATLDNIRRVLSGFFIWLEEEDYVIKSPVRKIHKVKTVKKIKEPLSDESVEKFRDCCTEIRDLAIADFLLATGVRVGELVTLNREDINFEERKCVVLGKGAKEREVYFDIKSKVHLMQYFESRTDMNPALFVSLRFPHNRLTVSGIETRIQKIGEAAKIERVHPHKFRRTMATKALGKGMPIEQVQVLLGHQQIETTLRYAIVNQQNVQIAHRKYIG